MTKICFENIENELSTTISIAEKRIFVAVAWFTNTRLFDGLTLALERNVAIKILILDDILNRNEFGLDYGVLSKLGAEVRFAKSDRGTMHNKFCIIDDLAITGSYNWTYRANKNSENILMTDDESVVNSYREEFDRLFGDAIPIPHPYEHIKWTDIKEGDFSELRRNIYRDVIAKNDENRELKRIKLINLNHAYKTGNIEELAKASAVPVNGKLKSITDVLTSKSRDYEFRLWEENIVGKPYNDVDEYIHLSNWFFVPYTIKEDQYHQTYVEGGLKTYSSLDYADRGLRLKVFDNEFVNVIRQFWGTKTSDGYELIPAKILTIENAKLFYYQFPTPMFNKSQPRTWRNTMPRTISAINLLGIAKEVNADNVVFYEGWDPQKRGEKIAKEFFTTSPIEQRYRTITDVMTNTQKRYVGELFYKITWNSDEEPEDIRFSTTDKWIFIPDKFGESKNQKKYIRGYFHFYKWFKKRERLNEIIKIDIYDSSFISCIERYLQGSMDINKIPEDLLCINLAKLSIIRLPKPLIVKEKNALAVFCLVKEVNESNIIYYEGWNPQLRGQEIIKKLRQG